MSSINTNYGAMTALQTLRSIDDQMNTTQQHISSGYRVATASDNGAYWSIATTMRSDNAALSAIHDALGLAAAKADVASTGINSAKDLLVQIKAKLSLAKEPGVDKVKLNSELTQLTTQLKGISQESTFTGENWLYNDQTAAMGTKELSASYIRSSTGQITIATIDVDTSTTILVDTKTATRGLLTNAYTITQPNGTTTTTATYYLINAGTAASGSQISLSATTTTDQVDGMITAVDAILSKVIDAGTQMGDIGARIKIQKEFDKNLMDAIDRGIGNLVDADMNEESTKLKALQTQQQLGIQALSIANNSAQNMLQLFR